MAVLQQLLDASSHIAWDRLVCMAHLRTLPEPGPEGSLAASVLVEQLFSEGSACALTVLAQLSRAPSCSTNRPQAYQQLRFPCWQTHQKRQNRHSSSALHGTPVSMGV